MMVPFVLNGCKTTSSRKEKQLEEAAAAWRNQTTKIPIGTIHLVDTEGGFVLIRSSRFLDVRPDQELIVTGSDGSETGRLRASAARKGSFLTADLLHGSPQAGNHVLMEHRPAAAEERRSGQPDRDEIQVLE